MIHNHKLILTVADGRDKNSLKVHVSFDAFDHNNVNEPFIVSIAALHALAEKLADAYELEYDKTLELLSEACRGYRNELNANHDGAAAAFLEKFKEIITPASDSPVTG